MDGHVFGWDATHANLPSAPPGQGAGYTTGSPDIRWTDADWHAHPGAIRICQDAAGSDETADVIDDEPGADTDTGSVGWYKRALADYHAGTRPGQRAPCFYSDRAGLPALEAAVRASGVQLPVPLWLADPDLTMDQAASMLGMRDGPFYYAGIQFAFRGAYDSDVWLAAWIESARVTPPPVTTPPPPTWTELLVRALPTLKQGDTGPAVRTLQGLLVARYYHLGATGKTLDGIDGDFGALTDAAVREVQDRAGLKSDGIVGPSTWPVLAGV